MKECVVQSKKIWEELVQAEVKGELRIGKEKGMYIIPLHPGGKVSATPVWGQLPDMELASAPPGTQVHFRGEVYPVEVWFSQVNKRRGIIRFSLAAEATTKAPGFKPEVCIRFRRTNRLRSTMHQVKQRMRKTRTLFAIRGPTN